MIETTENHVQMGRDTSCKIRRTLGKVFHGTPTKRGVLLLSSVHSFVLAICLIIRTNNVPEARSSHYLWYKSHHLAFSARFTEGFIVIN
jgi:hypothetical protein